MNYKLCILLNYILLSLYTNWFCFNLGLSVLIMMMKYVYKWFYIKLIVWNTIGQSCLFSFWDSSLVDLSPFRLFSLHFSMICWFFSVGIIARPQGYPSSLQHNEKNNIHDQLGRTEDMSVREIKWSDEVSFLDNEHFISSIKIFLF